MALSSGAKLPQIVVQMPVYKESLKEVIQLTYFSVKRAMDYYISKGGTVKFIICDDGFQVRSKQIPDILFMSKRNASHTNIHISCIPTLEHPMGLRIPLMGVQAQNDNDMHSSSNSMITSAGCSTSAGPGGEVATIVVTYCRSYQPRKPLTVPTSTSSTR